MAENITDSVVYYVEIAQRHKDYLGLVRHWSNLKVAADAGLYWVKDFTPQQIDSVEVKGIPFKQVYTLKENRLFPLGSSLPLKKMPSALLWTPIEKALPVSLPAPNHNFFGISEKIHVKLVASERQREPATLLTDVIVLKAYLQSAPAVRLKPLSWVIVNKTQALIIGVPLLPIQGDSFWMRDDFLLPTGFDLELYGLQSTINEQLNSLHLNYIWWHKNGSYTAIPKDQLQPLSVSSFRLSGQLMNG